MRPTLTGVSSKKRGVSPIKGSNKKRKVAEEEDEDEIERARRIEGSVAPSVMLGSDVLGRASIGVGLEFDNTNTGLDDFQMNVGEFDVPEMPDIGRVRARSRSAGPSERSRLSTPALDNAPLDDEQETYADSSCPIALFDERGQSQKETEGSQSSGRDYSQNTVKALAIIRKELQPQDDEPEEKVISFNKMAEKVRLLHKCLLPHWF
jgi:cohesin complex subunit SCC1